MILVEDLSLQNQRIIRSHCPTIESHAGCVRCENAKRWFIGLARSHDFTVSDRGGINAPIWLLDYFNWGPNSWPMHWCTLTKTQTVDCGVFRELSRIVFSAKGMTTYNAQVLRFQNPETTRHWKKIWEEVPQSFAWMSDSFVYHELVAVKSGAQDVQIYDSTTGEWVEPGTGPGHNANFAIRVESADRLKWRDKWIGGFQWIDLH